MRHDARSVDEHTSSEYALEQSLISKLKLDRNLDETSNQWAIGSPGSLRQVRRDK